MATEKESKSVVRQDNLICIRGLEHQTHQGGKTRRRNRTIAYTAVLEEQDRQFDTYELDEEKIAILMKMRDAAKPAMMNGMKLLAMAQ